MFYNGYKMKILIWVYKNLDILVLIIVRRVNLISLIDMSKMIKLHNNIKTDIVRYIKVNFYDSKNEIIIELL